MNKRKIALITGWSIILMALVSGFSLGYALPEFYPSDQASSLKDYIANNQDLLRNMVIGILIVLVLDVLVSYTLYLYFKEDNRKISIMSGILRFVYTLIFGVATFYLGKNLNVTELNSQSLNANFELFQSIWSSGLIVFGIHLLLIGFLMKLHNRIPKILWYITLFAGVCYIIIHLLKLVYPNLELATTLEMILTLPMVIGELGLAIWLLVKGGNK